MIELFCPACKTKLGLQSPHGTKPAFRCMDCNLSVVITNPSCLPEMEVIAYRAIVKQQRITRYNAELCRELANKTKETPE